MNVLRNTLYGILSGITEFLPVSVKGHQALVQYLFGIDARDPVLDLLVHIGTLIAILVSCREMLMRLYRQQRALLFFRRRKNRMIDSKSYYDLRLLKTATIPLLLSFCLYFFTSGLTLNLLSLMAFFVLNGIVLLIVEHVRHGNRDSRTMTGLDGIALGVVGSLSAFPGISRTAMTSSYAIARGSGSKHAADWSILLGIPALLFLLGLDVFFIISGGVGALAFPEIMSYLLAGCAAFLGGYIGISLLQLVLNYFGLSGFAYYSFGAAFFSFVLYLLT